MSEAMDDNRQSYVEVVKSKGKAPPQYLNWYEEEWNEESE